MEIVGLHTRPAAKGPLPVRVNGVEISRAAIAREIQNHPAEDAATAARETARALVVRELLLQEATRLGIEADPMTDADDRRETEEEALIRRLLDEEVKTPRADQDACRRFYEANLKRFRSEDLYEAAHILFAARADDPDAHASAVAQAMAAIRSLREKRSRFAGMAEALSACPSGKVGGSLGQLTAGQVTPEFADALSRMQPGEISAAPVTTRYGAHVIRLDRRIEGRTLPFEVVEDRIAAYLEDSVWRRAVAQYIQILAGRAAIEGLTLDAAASPLVQ
ncbi:peptidylprolyl isomerase [Lutibaculum baratangense]|uniref:Parvulin-like PPIase n=1 Tax=Lutibaculum baratangense AMV1 TaxID=631454 RepID=V4RHZ4_9HYPH|nr:peptidylprolyl isomerase [Lutibaculum baratangense]ESR25761.1 Peptidyl-prolyl cis-trans isomerase ppiD [Lutibaculum baratangense AMV1]